MLNMDPRLRGDDDSFEFNATHFGLATLIAGI